MIGSIMAKLSSQESVLSMTEWFSILISKSFTIYESEGK